MRQSVQGKRIFPGGQNSFVPHFAKLFGKRTAVDIQIVRQPLSAKIYPESATDLPAQKSRALPADFLYDTENDPRAAACLSVKPGGKSRQQSF